MIATQKSRRFGNAAVVSFGPSPGSVLRVIRLRPDSGWQVELCVCTVLGHLSLFNTAHGLRQMANISMPGETLLAVIKCCAGSPCSIFHARMERI
jgi:hypothetical protein